MPRPRVELGLEVPETSVMSFSLPGRQKTQTNISAGCGLTRCVMASEVTQKIALRHPSRLRMTKSAQNRKLVALALAAAFDRSRISGGWNYSVSCLRGDRLQAEGGGWECQFVGNAAVIVGEVDPDAFQLDRF
jgi:hypothetical protein